MIDIAVKIRGSAVVVLKKERERLRRAMWTAIRVEAHQMSTTSRKKLKGGQLGLKQLSVLEKAATGTGKGLYRYRKMLNQRVKKTGGVSNRKHPLQGLTGAIYYRTNKSKLSALVGFVGKPDGSYQIKHDKYTRYVTKSAKGYTWFYSEFQIKWIHSRGIHFKGPYTTNRWASVPARDVMQGIHSHVVAGSVARIRDKFYRSLRGERI